MSKNPKKKKSDKAWDKLIHLAKADQVEWERLIDSRDLRIDVGNLQIEYGFPLQKRKDIMDWIAVFDPFSEHEQRRQKLTNDIEALANKFGIPTRHIYNLLYMVITGDVEPRHLRAGFPLPPQPITKGNKKDWRPVWEWEQRHLDVTRKEIAERLGIGYVRLRRALEEIDKSIEW